MNHLHNFLIKTPLHKPALDINYRKILKKWSRNSNSMIEGHNTIYVFSPYKTGTTYVSSCFDKAISQHEPFHHASVKMMNNSFEKYFISRLNSLNLKLEASGFLSAHVEKLADNDIAKKLSYVCILRNPSSWATSVINHWAIVKSWKQYYFWTNEIFWKKYTGADLAKFSQFPEEEKYKQGEKLIDFYLDFTRKTKLLENVTYVWLSDLNRFIEDLGPKICEEVKLDNSDRNIGMSKKYIHNNLKRDEEYLDIVSEFDIFQAS